MLRAGASSDRNCRMSRPLLHLSHSLSSMSRLVMPVLCSLVCLVSVSLADRGFHSDATACILSPHPDTSRSQFVATLRSARNKIEGGAISGLVQASVFHPWDRALYLSQTERRSFLHGSNWNYPFQGISQTLALRIISASIFFPLEETLAPVAATICGNQNLAQFVAGNAAGGISAAAINPIQAIRAATFSKMDKNPNSNPHFFNTAKEMAAKGGIRPFLRGIRPTVGRDLVFGGFFSFLRRDFTSRISSAEHPPNPVLCFACDIAAATLATTFSSPFNYARNIMYSSPPGVRELKTMTLIGGLFKKAARQRNVWQSMVFLQNNLKIGVATLRVAFSMALAASTYRTYTAFEKKEKSEV